MAASAFVVVGQVVATATVKTGLFPYPPPLTIGGTTTPTVGQIWPRPFP